MRHGRGTGGIREKRGKEPEVGERWERREGGRGGRGGGGGGGGGGILTGGEERVGRGSAAGGREDARYLLK